MSMQCTSPQNLEIYPNTVQPCDLVLGVPGFYRSIVLPSTIIVPFYALCTRVKSPGMLKGIGLGRCYGGRVTLVDSGWPASYRVLDGTSRQSWRLHLLSSFDLPSEGSWSLRVLVIVAVVLNSGLGVSSRDGF